MKLKRIMAIVLCFAMVLSSMSFSVFAEEVTTVSDAAGLVAALINDQDSIEITLANDIEVPMSSLGEQTPGSGEYKLGGENTKSIVIDLNNHKMTITTGYMSAIGAKNEDATITIKNGSMNSTGNSHTTWNINDLMFANCNYEFENVIFDKEVALTNTGKNVTMKNVTINGTGDYYALWIQAEGQNVTIDGLTINTPGRGIKIDEQYSNENVAKVTLDVTNATFTTAKKAAIMVKSAEGAKITTTNVDISAVAADSKNIVWVDEDSADYQDKVIVNDNAAFVEGTVATVNGVGYTDVATALAEATDGAEVKIFAAGTYKVPAGKDITITGAVDGVKFDMSNAVGVNASMTFNKVTFEYGNENYKGLQHARDMAYNDCTINGQVFLYGNSETFNNCTFNQTSSDAYNVWTYGAKKVEFNECTFNSAGKSVLIYSEQADLVNDVTVTKTTFNASAAVDGKAAIEMDSSLTAGINLAIDSETTATGFGTGNKSGNSLWNNKNGNDTEANNDIIVTVNDETVLEPVTLPVKVATKDELVAAIANSTDGDRILLTADIDYGTDQLKIEKPITLDLGGMMLTTRNAWGGMSVKNNPTIKNGTIVHASNTAAIKVWNATAFEDLVIDVQGKGDANKTIGGIVLQPGTTTRVDSMKNVTIKGVALTNGIETYNCGDATNDVIGFMENVDIDAVGTAMNISAPVGTATGCTFKGGVNGIEIWIKGNYSAKLDLVDCDVVGGVYAHDEFNSNPGIQNIGTISLTADANSTGADEDDITLTIARAENVEGVLEDVMNNSKAKLGDTYYPTFGAAIEAAQNGDTVTLLADVKLTGKFTITKEITIVGNGYRISADETAVWHTTSGKLNIKKYNKHLIGINADNVTLKNIVLDNNDNAAGINLYCAQNVLFDNVSIINATKGMAALTVNGSTLTIKTNFDALGNAIAMDISNGSDVTSNLGVTVEDGTVFDLDNKTVKFGEAAAINMSNAVYADGNPYFAAMDNAYLYTEKQINSRTNAFSNGLTLLSDVELSKVITVKGTLNINGKTLTIPDNKELDVKYNLEIVKAGGTINGGFNITSADAKITAEKGLDVSTNVADSAVIYVNGVYRVVPAIAKIGQKLYGTLADALAAAKDGETVTLIWNEGDAPIAMDGAVFGKTITVTGDATVDWNKGFLFIGRGGEGNGTVIFDNANLKSASNSSSYGIHVSGREKDTTNKYNGTLVINNSTIELDYLINKGTMTLDNSTLTVKNGFSVGGRPASETESGVDATATIDLKNGSKVVVNNHNGMGLGYEAIGVMNIDKTSAFECTQDFLITSKGRMYVNGGSVNVNGKLNVNGTLKSNGNVYADITAGSDAVIEINGGLYLEDVSEWCVDGYKCKATKKGKYFVYPEFVVEAIADVETAVAGETITVQVKVTKGGNYTNADWTLKYDPRYVTYTGTDAENYKISGLKEGVFADGYDCYDETTTLGTYTFTVNEILKDNVTAVFDIVDAHVHNYQMALNFDGVPANTKDDEVVINLKAAEGSIATRKETYNGTGWRGYEVSNAPAGATVIYSTTKDFSEGTQLPPVFNKVGEHTYYAQIKVDGYATDVVTGKLIITAKKVTPGVEWMVAPESNKVEFKPVIKDVVDSTFNGEVTVTYKDAAGNEKTVIFDDMSKFAYNGEGKAVYTGNAEAISGIKSGEFIVTVAYTAGANDNYADGEATEKTSVSKSTISDAQKNELEALIDADEAIVYDGNTHEVTVDTAALKALGWEATVVDHDGVTNYGDVNVVDVTFTDTTGKYNDYTATVMIKIVRRATTIKVNNVTKKNGQKDDEVTTYTITPDLVKEGDLGEIKVVRVDGQDGEAEGWYGITATFTPNDNYDVYVDDGTLTISDAVFVVEVVDNANNDNKGKDAKSDYTAGSVANGYKASKMILVHTDADNAFFTYKGAKMYDVTAAGYDYYNHNYATGDHIKGKKYKHVYAIVVDAEYGDVETEVDEAKYADNVKYAGKDRNDTVYGPVKITYDADINDKNELHINDYSTVMGVYGGIYNNVQYQISILKADYNCNKLVNSADAQEVKNAILGE